MQLLNGIFACLLYAAASCAFAHGDEYFDSTRAPHGGQVRMAGPFHFELVVERQSLIVHVTDHADNPVATRDGSAKAIITNGKHRYVVILKPAGETALRGSGDFKLGRYNTVQLMVALPDQPIQHANFVYPKGAKPTVRSKKKHTDKASGTGAKQ